MSFLSARTVLPIHCTALNMCLEVLGKKATVSDCRVQEEKKGDGSWEIQLIPFSRGSQSGAFSSGRRENGFAH